VKRHGKLLLGIVGAIVALVMIVIVVVATFDWNRAKPWVVATVSQAIGRSLVTGRAARPLVRRVVRGADAGGRDGRGAAGAAVRKLATSDRER